MTAIKRRPRPSQVKEVSTFAHGDVVEIGNDYQAPVLHQTFAGWQKTGKYFSPTVGMQGLCMESAYYSDWPVVEVEKDGNTFHIPVHPSSLKKL